jgi:hypothetical protein
MTAIVQATEIIGLEPVSITRPADAGGAIAPRPSSLAGLTIGVIANGLGNSLTFLERLVTRLQETQSVADSIVVAKGSVSVPATAEQWQLVTSRADVAITGFGGCGSCSSRSLRDAIDLERAGIPSVAIIHEALHGSARAISEISGAPGFPFATVHYPHSSLAGWDEDESRAVVDEVVDEVIRLLIGES